MKYFFKRYQLVLPLMVAGVMGPWLISQAKDIQINLDVAVCNLNSICEPMIGETTASCPADCPAATSTPPTATSTPVGPGGSQDLDTLNAQHSREGGLVGPLVISPSATSATMTWVTSLPSLATLSWGSTLKYEIGSTAQPWYHTRFVEQLDNLEPNTRYYFLLTLRNSLSLANVIEGSFLTLPLPDTQGPSSPDDFIAFDTPKGIVLQWSNPKDPDFSFVRITRSLANTPADPFSGKVIYEGGGEYVRDENVSSGVSYFYSLYSFDTHRNYSAPAIVRIKHTSPTQKETNVSQPHYDPLLKDLQPLNIFQLQNIQPSLCSPYVNFLKSNSRNSAVTVFQSNKQKYPVKKSYFISPDQAATFTVTFPNISNPSYYDGKLILCLSLASEDYPKAFRLSYDKNSKLFKVTLPPIDKQLSYNFYIGLQQGSLDPVSLQNGVLVATNPDTSKVTSRFSFRTFIQKIIYSSWSFFTSIFK